MGVHPRLELMLKAFDRLPNTVRWLRSVRLVASFSPCAELAVPLSLRCRVFGAVALNASQDVVHAGAASAVVLRSSSTFCAESVDANVLRRQSKERITYRSVFPRVF